MESTVLKDNVYTPECDLSEKENEIPVKNKNDIILESFLKRLKKQIDFGYFIISVSTDPDEFAEIHVNTDNEIYLDRVLLPYSISDVVRICHKIFEDAEDDSYIRIYFKDGDWLSIDALCGYTAKIKGVIYHEKDVVHTYYSITNKRLKQHLSTPKDVLDQIDKCAEKAEIFIDISKEEDEDSEIWFDDNAVLWIDWSIRTPYKLEDIESIIYRNDDVERYVSIILNIDGDLEFIDMRDYGKYTINVSRGKMASSGGYYQKNLIDNKYQSIIKAKEQGIYKDEFVVIDGVLIRYNGDNTEIEIPEGVQTIEDHMFYATAITSVKCPSTLRLIQNYCFAHCSKLLDVKLNEGLETIEYNAFYRCKKLENINKPSTLISIGDDAFGKTPVEDNF